MNVNPLLESAKLYLMTKTSRYENTFLYLLLKMTKNLTLWSDFDFYLQRNSRYGIIEQRHRTRSIAKQMFMAKNHSH